MPDLPPSTVVRSASLVGALAFGGLTASGVWMAAGADDAAAPGAASGRTAGEKAARSLDALRWQRRLIVAVGESPTELAELERLVEANLCRLDERETDVHHVTPERAVPLSPGAGRLDATSRDALVALGRAAAGAAASAAAGDESASTDRPFALLLIGKDGGVKRRATAAAALPDFLEAIDGMPMRRAEMARDAGDC